MSKNLEDYSREELIEQIKTLKRQKRFGLVWEEKPEKVVEECDQKLPVLEEVPEKAIKNAPNEPTNIIIEGDNYHALSVLNYTHASKVDVIYIDPPYNTGNKDFIYNDNYVDKEDTFRHSKWLSFMNRRLKLAKNLLSDDGIILISIDDNEQAELRMLCDQVFGRKLESMLIWKTKTAAKGVPPVDMIVTNHDYILMYSNGSFKFKGEERDDSQFSNPDNDPRGPWKADNMKSTISTKYFTIKNPETGEEYTKNWAFSEETIKEMIESNKIIWPTKKGGTPRQKRFKSEYTNETMPLRTLIGEYQSETATNKLKDIFGTDKLSFNNPKPKELIQFLVEQTSKKNSVVLDFFAGSGTTGQAVLELNKEDGGHRQFILCTNDENKIAENVTYPRIKTVITGIRQDGTKYSDGIPANLAYFKTDFVEKGATTDDTREAIIEKCADMVRIRENAFETVKNDIDYKLYKNSENYVAVIFNQFDIENIWHEIEQFDIEKLPVKTYVFSYNNHANEEEIPETELDWSACAVPESILEIYRKIFRKKEAK